MTNSTTLDAHGGVRSPAPWDLFRRIRIGTLALAACWGLVACGGGGGGGGGAAIGGSVGVLKVVVKDTFGAAVAGAAVTGTRSTVPTDAQGVALLSVDPNSATASITVTRDTFIDQLVSAPLSPGVTNEVVVTLVRMSSPAGGSLGSRSGFISVVDAGKQQMTFEVELVLVDGNSNPITNLTQSNFQLRACTPDAANQRADCIRGANDAADIAYVPTVSAPSSIQSIAALPVVPYAAALLMDQSGSILQSDASGARLFSTKAFLNALSSNDRVLLSAFAGGTGALITPSPLAIYDSFKDSQTASTYFRTLDSLAKLVGGTTPLYESLDTLRGNVVNDASLPANIAKAVVVFTDGEDTSCTSISDCRARRQLSIDGANASNVKLFTVGLSDGVDFAALGELAVKTNGAFLYADTPQQLLPLYGSVGKLLSLGLPTYRLQWTVQSGAGAFQPGSTLIGRVQVTSGANTFEVPFVVGIP